jgi:hypothetical protein
LGYEFLLFSPLKAVSDLEEIGIHAPARSFVSPLFIADRAPRRGSKDASFTHGYSFRTP